jgi:nucleotide-binding universal stress UspA family protein
VSNRRVVVGVDNLPGTQPALSWAVAEAAARRSELMLLHSLDFRDTPAGSVTDLAVADRIADRMLTDLAATVQAESDRPVRTRLSHAGATEALIDASGDCDLLVLGSNGMDDLVVSMLGTVGHRVAAHAQCPTVIVPRAPLRTALPADASVVVGLAASRAGRLALRLACQYASLHGYPVTAVRVNPVAGDIELAELSDMVATDWPRLDFRVRTAEGEPCQRLLEACRGSRLLVLGCHHSTDRFAARLGSVPAALLGRLECPLMLVGQLS